MPIVIRAARPSDAAVIAEFNCLLARESEGTELDPPVVARGVAALLADPSKGSYIVACEGEQILGQLAITFEWSDWRDGWLWWIQSVYVRQEARGRGVFRALHSHITAAALAAGNVVGIRLYVEEHNSAGKNTYAAVGMKPAGYVVFDQPIFRQNS